MNRERGSLNRDKLVKEKENDSEKRKDIIESHINEIEEENIENSKSVSQMAFEKSFDELLSVKNIKMKTDITKSAVIELSKAEVMLEEFNLPIMRAYTDAYSEYSVSKNRKGREEIVKLTTNRSSIDEGSNFDNSFSRIKDRLL